MPAYRETGILTIAAIRKPKDKGRTQYLFNERQEIFTFQPKTKKAETYARDLKTALSKKKPVKVQLDIRRGLIQKIEPPTPEEVKTFKAQRILLERPDRPRRIDVREIDPTTFDIVDHYLKWKIFLRCKRTVPNYKRAEKIFKYCAKQSCHLPGPYDISPCIPFQYVRDGCYARAHKMRWIITTKFRYCCEKVFSFANEDDDVLAVKATNWGGCCVAWWYHVAPLIRVRVGRLFEFAMVIDPGMFDKPVLLSTWLAAQENTACHANANVSKYSIQPGSAYSPGNYAGTQFTTDPNYTSTDATLNAYHSFVTCP